MKIGANFPAKTPEGPIEDKWTSYKNKIDLVNPANKRLIDIIVVGTGLAGGSAAASLAELGLLLFFSLVLFNSLKCNSQRPWTTFEEIHNVWEGQPTYKRSVDRSENVPTLNTGV